MSKVFAIAIAAGLAGCGWVHGSDQHSGKNPGATAKAGRVFVTYHGPQQLTRRFQRFFEIAADDFGVVIAEKANGADALMDVTITEKEVQDHIHATVLRAGFVLQQGKTATVEHCLSTGNGDGPHGPIAFTGIASQLKQKYPSILKVFVDPIKGNVEPQVSEVAKKELIDDGYVLAADAAHADAVLRAIGTTREQIPLSATRYHISYTISGAVTVNSETSPVIYRSIIQPFPEKAKTCLNSMDGWLYPNSMNGTDAFWTSAVSAARDLAKPKEDHSKKD